MPRQTFFLASAALFVALATPSEGRSWGCFHAGFTHVGYGGIHHFGTTDLYGAGRFGGISHYGYTDRYGYGGYHYGGTSIYGARYGAYPYAGYHYGGYPYGGYTTGYYRRW